MSDWALEKIEGHWRNESNPHLPVPKPDGWTSEKNRQAFMKALYKVQTKARKKHYKGSSTCRMCKRQNGSAEYSYKGWRWPDGLMHYIVTHKVRPSKAFRKFVTEFAKKL